MKFKIGKNPEDKMSITNYLYFNPADWDIGRNKFVIIDDPRKQFVFRCDTSNKVEKGFVTMGNIQRKYMYKGVNEFVECNPYSFPTSDFLSEVVLTLELFQKNATLKDTVDSDKLAIKFLDMFIDSPLSFEQSLLFNWESINFIVCVKEMKVVDVKSSSVKSDVTNAVIRNNTVIKFERHPNANFVLGGRSKAGTGGINIINPDWDFNSIGVGGLDTEFSNIFRRAFISRLLPTDYIEDLGLKHVRGILLYGPPGTGKTLMARQIGKMLQAREPKIVNGPSILDKYVGESEANIRRLFADAEEEFKRMGNNSPLHIIIFDEIDAICKARGSIAGGSAVQDTVVNQLLSKLDGVEQLNNILVIGMTNRKDMIDEALLRPGRLEVQIEIPLPTEGGRLQIFGIHTQKLKSKSILDTDVDLMEMARLTKNFSGAEIEGLVKAAISNAQSEKFDPKKGLVIKLEDLESFRVSRKHFLYALEHDVKPFFGRHDEELQEFVENPIIMWGRPMQEFMNEANDLIESIKDQHVCKSTVLLYGPPHAGKTSLAVHLAQKTGFTFVRLSSIRNMIGFSESARCLSMKKIFDDALKAPTSVVILDDLEDLVDHFNIGPRFSTTLVKSIIGMVATFVPKTKKMLIIGTTSNLSAMRELGLLSAFGNTTIRVPPITQPKEIMTVVAEQDLLNDEEIGSISAHMDGEPINIGVKNVIRQCGILKSADKRERLLKLVVHLRSTGDDIGY